MILEYHKPESIEEALRLLSRPTPPTIPLGGGTVVAAPSDKDFAVVDLALLGLDKVKTRNNFLEIGATATLNTLARLPEAKPILDKTLYYETTYNLRQVATVAGTVVASDGRSPLNIALMALDARVHLLPDDEEIDLGQMLNARETFLSGRLITNLIIPIHVDFVYKYVARTPADLPIIAVAAARWPSGRLRIVIGGFGSVPRLALDAPDPGGIEFAVKNVCANATDKWATAFYRQEIAAILSKRCVDALLNRPDTV